MKHKLDKLRKTVQEFGASKGLDKDKQAILETERHSLERKRVKFREKLEKFSRDRD